MELDPHNPAVVWAGLAGLTLAFFSLYSLLGSMPHWRAWLKASSPLPQCPLLWVDLLLLFALFLPLALMGAGLLMPAFVVVAAVLLFARHGIAAGWYWGLEAREYFEYFRVGGKIYLTIFLPLVLLTSGSLWLFEKWGFKDILQEPVRLFLESQNPWFVAQILVLAVIVAPVWEEIFFRGVLFPFFKERTGRWQAVALNGLVFGVAHGHWPSFLVLALLGMLLALIYDRTGKLGYCISLHFFFNLVTTSFLVIQKYGKTLATSSG